MIRQIRFVVLLGLLIACLIPTMLMAQSAVVYGVLFYSPTCPHCHEVINNHWPKIQTEFGDQLQVLFIDASGMRGNALMQAARKAMHIESNGVPMLIIGSEVLIGSLDIPARAPTVIRAGIEAGGIALPPIPGIEEVFQAAVEQVERQQAEQQSTGTNAPSSIPPEALADRLASDPIANAAAILILVLLVCSLLIIVISGWRKLLRADDRLLNAIRRHGRSVLTLLSFIGMGLAISLVAGWNQDWVVLLLAVLELTVFIIIAVVIRRSYTVPGWLISAGALAGLAVAGYLAFVEISLTEAVCGAIGDCNTVQQSPYARVFSIPIGVIGVVGYLGLIIAWVLSWRWQWLKRVLMGGCVFGVAFSTYLTFLEPFVIGATCIWCLLSAIWMLLILWIVIKLDDQAGSLSVPIAAVIRST